MRSGWDDELWPRRTARSSRLTRPRRLHADETEIVVVQSAPHTSHDHAGCTQTRPSPSHPLLKGPLLTLRHTESAFKIASHRKSYLCEA